MSEGGDLRVGGFADLDPVTAYRLWALRSRVFVVEQDCPYLDLDGRDLEPATRHWWVERDGIPVATLRVLDDGDVWRIGRVVTAVDWRGQGLAAQLVRAVLAGAGERDVVLEPSPTSSTGMPRWVSFPMVAASSMTGSPTPRCGVRPPEPRSRPASACRGEGALFRTGVR
jgi:GNAT superfamily N-acetyltransferase